MAVVTQSRDTLNDLMKVKGKAELIAGRIVHHMPTGRKQSRIASCIYQALLKYQELTGQGEAFNDNIGYALQPPLLNGRESFSPDASYYASNDDWDSSDFIDGPPTFAAEVRSKNNYGPSADAEIAEKISDYFEAGTLVVWDVDYRSKTVSKYVTSTEVTVFRTGEIADAEPALPGWRMPVDAIFPS